ncbi:MAG TPA: hypothetical protein VNU71_13380 [Burkholderiaceae bacterium]|nr:hypothetical protein [Burkholderiaceae bacterium]
MSAQLSFFPEPPPPPPNRHEFTREQQRDGGITRAIKHADRTNPEWSEVAFLSVKVFLLGLKPGDHITGEQARQHGEKKGVSAPPDKRAWGGIMRRAAGAGLIRKVGYVQATDPRVHCNPITDWVRV